MNPYTYCSLSDEILVDKQMKAEIGLPENPVIIAIAKFIIENAQEVWQDCSGK